MWHEEYENLEEVKKYTALVKRFYDKPSKKYQLVGWIVVVLGLISLPFILYGLHLLGVIG